jgi:hypothetical protein
MSDRAGRHRTALISATWSGTTSVTLSGSLLSQVAVNRTPAHGWPGPSAERRSASCRAAGVEAAQDQELRTFW